MIDYDLEWRPLPRDMSYMVSENGDIVSLVRKVAASLKRSLNSSGYLQVALRGNDVLTVHAAVAETYIGTRPKGLVVNHIDGNELNNSYHNLEYCSNAENIRHGRTIDKPRKIINRLNKIETEALFSDFKSGHTHAYVSEKYNISRSTVKNFRRGYRQSGAININ